MDLTSVDHVLTTTRTVRKRLDLARTVEPEVLLDSLRVAIQAPTGSNLQRWRWVVVTDPEKRAAVAQLYEKAITPYLDIMEKAFGGREDNNKVIDSARYLADKLPQVPVHVIPCALGNYQELGMLLKGGGYPFEISDNLTASGFYGSIWPAVWNFMLALRARGLGSALTTMHLAFEKEMGELLGIPDTVSQVGLIAVAYFTGEDFKPAKRKPAPEVTYWNGWKGTLP
ncbi:MAG: nitroreductase family protein [Actinomycetota bacterium]